MLLCSMRMFYRSVLSLIIFAFFAQLSSGNKTPIEHVESLLAAEANETCSDHQIKLSKAIADVSSCAVKHARPVTMCRNCAVLYNSTVATFQRLNDTECYNQFFLQDRIAIIQMVFDGAVNVWLQSRCDDCYRKNNYSELNDETKVFFEKLEAANSCFDKSEMFGSKMNVCSECKEVYKNLTTCYQSLLQDKRDSGGEYHICMDVVDSMNITRHRWNVGFKCRQFISDGSIGTLNIVTSVIVCLAPLAFYIFSRFFFVRDSIEIFKTKRRSFVQNGLSQ